jgi:hypothetical protein
LEIDSAKTRVDKGEAWKRFYGALGNEQPNCNNLDGARDEFVTELCRAFPQDAKRILDSFIVAAAGVPNLPVRYPRVGQPGQPVAPNPAGEGYEWFVANDAGLQLTLPNLTDDDPGLPNDVRGSGRR